MIRRARPEVQQRRHVSLAGVTAMSAGLAAVAVEFRFGMLQAQFGFWARVVLFLSAVSFSVWGLKEIIAAWWPGALPYRVRTRRNRFMLPLEGQAYALIMLVLFCGSALGRSNALLLVFALMAGPFIMNGWITFTMLKRLSVRRSSPERVMAGEPFSVELELRNPKRWFPAWLMSVRDSVTNGREDLHPEVLFTRVPPRKADTRRYQLRLSQRGWYSFGQIQINTRFPLGMVERGLVFNAADQVLVYPRIGRFTAAWRRQLWSATRFVDQARARGGSFNDDFHRIREYRPGDDPRAIHWRTSARREELMVREFRESRDRNLILLLDVYLPLSPTEAQRQRLEYAISVAATMAHEQMATGHGTDISFAANAEPLQEWHGSAQHGGREEFLDLLALLQANPKAKTETLFDAAQRLQTSHSRTVLITTERERMIDWNASTWSNGDSERIVAIEPPQFIVADPTELAGVFSPS